MEAAVAVAVLAERAASSSEHVPVTAYRACLGHEVRQTYQTPPSSDLKN